MADLYLTPAEKYTAALGGFYYVDLPEPGTVYTQLIKDILDGSTPDKVPKNILARFIYSLYISDLGDPYPRYELAKLLYWKLHDITPTKSGSVLAVTIDGKEDYMTINTYLSRLWYKVLFGSKIDVITEFPHTFNTIQTKLSDWELFGNAETSGTPTPDNPVMPEGTGERTGNLFDKDARDTIKGYILNEYLRNNGETTSSAGWRVSEYIDINEMALYTLDYNGSYNAPSICFYDNNKNFISGAAYSGRLIIPIETPEGAKYCRFSFCDTAKENIMFNEGSALLPYEPFGVKIPISSANTTTPVYLGEVESTRRVKKLVFTGEESFTQTSDYQQSARFRFKANDARRGEGTYSIDTIISSHYVSATGFASGTIVQSNGTDINLTFNMQSSTYPDLTTFKNWLAQQYAAGTPVTVWYVLATEETGIVNEPLMKIGEYADSMSRTQTGIDIPTVIGQNTLDVLTTVKPSSMSIEYTSADENRSRSKRISLLKSPLKKGLIK